MATVAYASMGKAKGWFFRFLVAQQRGLRGRWVRYGVVWNPRDGEGWQKSCAPEIQRRDGGGSEGCRSCARVGVDLAPSTPAGSIPRDAPLASNPRQHSAVTRAVRNPRGPLPLPGLPVYPSAPGANGHVVAGSFTDVRQPNPVFPFQITVAFGRSDR